MHANAQLSRAKEMQPERTEDCTICKKTGCLTSDGWYSETILDRDDDGFYAAGHGEYLGDAIETPAGWVCSKRCRSQDMYNRAGDYDKAALRKVHDACRVIAEYGKDILRFVDGNMDDAPTYLTDAAGDFLDAVAESDDPAWCNRETREDALDGVIRSAYSDLELSAYFASVPASCAMTTDHPGLWHESEVRISARSAASMARIALDLRDAAEANHA